MQKKSLLSKGTKAGILFLLFTSSMLFAVSDGSQLESGFLNPPDSAKPQTWWHWINGNVTAEGITADLEAMKRVGLGGFEVFSVGYLPAGPVSYMSDEWRKMMTHTARESERLGLQMCMHNCDGWSSSGGPWITPEYAMKKVVWTEKQVDGGNQLNIKLDEPDSNSGYYRDIAVLAFPTPASEYKGGNAFRISNWKYKTGFERPNITPKAEDIKPADSDIIHKDKMIVLTSMMDSSGNLQWQAPVGKWTIIRFGYTPTGKKNVASSKPGQGLECDKLNKAAAKLSWENTVQKVMDDAGRLTGKSFNNVLIDSYETGCQNWTEGFAQEFKKRIGYDITLYMPVITGRVVDSPEVSERFLWDFCRVIADMFTENYFGYFAEMCHKNKMMLSIEPYGNGNFDEFDVASKADIPMGEWWSQSNKESWHHWSGKLSSSSAHCYGRKYVGAEAFTTSWTVAGYTNHPYLLKSQGDYFYCQGVNRFIFHTYAHQPWMNVVPGMTMGPWGMQFHRNNTWFEKATEWLKYLARCQYLLQEGKFAADLCYFAGENAPSRLTVRREITPMPPDGYDYDFCTVENLMQMKVKDGIIYLPSGMSYRMLVLPSGDMRPAVLNQIEKLVKAGAIIYGDKPEKSPSLKNYPACDNEVKKIADKLWGSGKIISQKPLAEVLLSKGILPDFEFSGNTNKAPTRYPGKGFEYIHRQIDGADVYFVSNQYNEAQEIEAVFRINHELPELWHPDSGKTEEAPAYLFTKDGRMTVPLSLDPSGSVFVVFRKPVSTEKKADKEPEITSSEIIGSWVLRFPAGWGDPEEITLDKLIDWTEHENYDIQHFSGTATYVKDFEFSPAAGSTSYLDLGIVNVIAEVKLNGKNLGILWKPPFRVEITDVVKAGSNHLEIEVTNCWANRLIGDEKYPADWKREATYKKRGYSQCAEFPKWLASGGERPESNRKTFSTWQHWKADAPLLPSGMPGPVQILYKNATKIGDNK